MNICLVMTEPLFTGPLTTEAEELALQEHLNWHEGHQKA